LEAEIRVNNDKLSARSFTEFLPTFGQELGWECRIKKARTLLAYHRLPYRPLNPCLFRAAAMVENDSLRLRLIAMLSTTS